MEKYSQTTILLGGIVIGAGAVLAVGWLSDRPPEAPPERKPPPAKATEDIRNALEECIGNTPLIKVKYLSEASYGEVHCLPGRGKCVRLRSSHLVMFNSSCSALRIIQS